MVSLRVISFSILLCLTGNSACAQGGFLGTLEAEIIYTSFDGWRTSRGPNVNEDNDGSGLGIAFKYPMRNAFFIKGGYLRSRIFSQDLERHYGLSNLFITAGRSFKLFKKGELGIKAGWAHFSKPLYTTFIIQVPGRPQPSVTHTYEGKSGFNHLGLGIEYKFRAGEELFMGMSIDAYAGSVGNSGATLLSLFINMKLDNRN